MKSFRKFLKGLELEDETIDAIVAQHGAIVTKNLERITELDGQVSEIETLRGQVTELDNLKNEKVTLEQNHATELEQTKNNYESQITKMYVENELSKKFKDPKDVYSQLNLESIKRDGETLTGLEEQTKALLESKPYLALDSKARKTSITHNEPAGDDMSKYLAIYGIPEEK